MKLSASLMYSAFAYAADTLSNLCTQRHTDTHIQYACMYTHTYLEVLWRDHGTKLDGLLISEHLIRPSPNRTDKLDCSYSIVGHKDFFNNPLATESVYILLRSGYLKYR